MPVVINEGTTFLLSDDLGNVSTGSELGLYGQDRRFLSRYELLLDGQPPLLLAARATDSYAATHYLTNPTLPAVSRGQLSIARTRHVGQGLHDDLDVVNYGDREAAFALELHVDADFAHIFEVKRAIEATRETIMRDGIVGPEAAISGRSLSFRDPGSERPRRLIVRLSKRAEISGGSLRFDLRLAPQARWRLCLDFVPSLDDDERREPTFTCQRRPSPEIAAHREHRNRDMLAAAPHLDTDSDVLRHAYAQSVADFARLCIKGEDLSAGEHVIAAGIPWFMTLFGRDSVIATYQALVFYPDHAKGVLRVLARLQGKRVDQVRQEEPGKILHEHRASTAGGSQPEIPGFPYFGTIDATPLFLMLLAGVYRLTGDVPFVRSLREPALRALDWMDRYGDRDGDGYLEYVRDVDVGLENQGWKDSGDAIRFRDGRIAQPPIALCEVQGYAYAARLGMAEVFEALAEPERAARLRGAAAELKVRFNRDFWLEERGSYALALDGNRRAVDALTSNPGHLLWTGLADEDKARRLADRLLTPELFSGWGVRTMATTEGGYNPISYHNGSVWPHDNSLIVAGLARYGFVEQAARVTDGLLAALSHEPDHQLPELFAGYSRAETSFPVDYPTANRPQAWASASVFLLLTAMLGLDASAPGLHGTPFLPPSVERLQIDGLWLGRRRSGIEVARQGAHVSVRPFDGALSEEAARTAGRRGLTEQSESREGA